MFDTVRCSVSELNLDQSRLFGKGFQRMDLTKVDGEGEMKDSRRYQLMRKGEYPHYLSYSPESGTLVSETSLPKMRHNSNVVMLSSGDVPQVLNDFSNRVSDIVGDVPAVSGWDVRGRLDACYMWDVSDRGKNYVADYLNALKVVELSRHYSQNVDRESTLYWRNGSRVIRLYDKERESRDESARGLLRFEVELKHAKKELGFVGGSLKLGDVLNWDTARGVMQKYLLGLGADLVISDEKMLVSRLVDVYGYKTARRLYGSLCMSRLWQESEMKSKFGVERTMIWRDRRDIQKAGVNAAVSDSGVLPPLSLPVIYDGRPTSVFL